LVVVVGAVADRARASPHLEALCIDVDEEGGDALARALLRFIGAADGEEDDEVRTSHAADEMLAAVDDEVVTVPHRAGLDAHGVGPGVGLGEREGFLALALDGRDQVAVALLALAGVEDLRGAAHPADETVSRLADL